MPGRGIQPGAQSAPQGSAGGQDVTEVSTRQCAQCGILMDSPHWRRRYCSDRCRDKARFLRGKEDASLPHARGVRNLRRPLPNFAKDAGWALRKDIERLERIFADDRLPLHKDQVAASLRGHLKYTAEVCHDLLSQLDKIGD